MKPKLSSLRTRCARNLSDLLSVLCKSRPRIIFSSLIPELECLYKNLSGSPFSSLSTRRLWKVDFRHSQTCACVCESVCQSDLRVSHAGGCNESLLQSFALQSAVLLVSLGTPFQIQQVLDNLRVSTQSGVDQRGLAALINVVDLEDVQ